MISKSFHYLINSQAFFLHQMIKQLERIADEIYFIEKILVGKLND